MDTRIWGPSAWKLLHSITFNYPGNTNKSMQKKYQSFFNNIKDILPCIHCRNSYKEYISNLPFTDQIMTNNFSLSQNLFKIHNKVNHKLLNQFVIMYYLKYLILILIYTLLIQYYSHIYQMESNIYYLYFVIYQLMLSVLFDLIMVY